MGRDEGRAEAWAEVLLTQATQRFGALSPEHEHRIRRADAAHLKEWLSRILTAATLDDLLRAL